MTEITDNINLPNAITLLRNLRAIIKNGGKGFMDGVHLQWADTFLKQVEQLEKLDEPETMIAVWGNPIQGYKAFGPFENIEAAHQFGEDMGEGGEWYMTVHAPTSDNFCKQIHGLAT
jgi:hypothetical protein